MREGGLYVGARVDPGRDLELCWIDRGHVVWYLTGWDERMNAVGKHSSGLERMNPQLETWRLCRTSHVVTEILLGTARHNYITLTAAPRRSGAKFG